LFRKSHPVGIGAIEELAPLIERDLLNEKIAILEADRPFARRRRKP